MTRDLLKLKLDLDFGMESTESLFVIITPMMASTQHHPVNTTTTIRNKKVLLLILLLLSWSRVLFGHVLGKCGKVSGMGKNPRRREMDPWNYFRLFRME